MLRWGWCVVFTLCLHTTNSQILFDQDMYNGGLISYTKGVGGGFSTLDYQFTPNIPQGSVIKQVLLLATYSRVLENDSTYPLTVFINGNSTTISIEDKVGVFYRGLNLNTFTPPYYSVCLSKEVTNLFTSYPYHIVTSEIRDFYDDPTYETLTFIIKYEHPNYPLISTEIYLNTQDSDSVVNVHLSSINKVSNNKPVALSVIMSDVCDTVIDGTDIYVNNNHLGLVGWDCSGVNGCFDYHNDTLYGLDDDTPDSLMIASDALADIKSYVNFGDTTMNVRFDYQKPIIPSSGVQSNTINHLILAHSTKCDTLNTYVNIEDTTICAGESLALHVGGDTSYTYQWRYHGEVVSTENDVFITPEYSRLYSILIKDSTGCGKTELISINVNPLPTFNTTVTPAICPQNNGSIVIDSVGNTASPFWYKNGNSTWQTAPVFGYLADSTYTVSVRDSNNCIVTQNITVPEEIITTANFTYDEPLPYVPTELSFTNTSQNSNTYQWYINNDSVSDAVNLNAQFENEGTYTITLIASNNGQCKDTLTRTLQLNQERYLYIPSVNNGSLNIYSHGYTSVVLQLYNALGQEVFQQTHALNAQQTEIVPPRKLAKGIYFYNATATTNNGDVYYLSGKIVF